MGSCTYMFNSDFTHAGVLRYNISFTVHFSNKLFSLKFTAQLFGSPPPQPSNPPVLQQQTSLTRTPSNTPTPTPPPQILSPPVIPVTAARKTTSLQESGTVHHLAQTPHHANVATYMQGQGQGMCNYIMSHTVRLL